MDRTARGFSLLEVLVATTLVTVALSSLAQLVVLASRANAGSRTATFAYVLAEQKMEQLRTDDALAVSPPGALGANVPGYVDYLDANGRLLNQSAAPPDDAAFVRRWSVVPLSADDASSLVIQVVVTRGAARVDARLVSVKRAV